MRAARYVLLTGGTGLLGRYLLRDLLASGRRVAVLARGGRGGRAEERIGAVVSSWEESLGVDLPPPAVLEGDLCEPGLGLGYADRSWLARRCDAVVHAAASVALCPANGGEPRRTNAEGTRNLLALCTELGLSELHHVSTAFVCGRRAGVIAETEPTPTAGFHNEYEASKYEAEQAVRNAAKVRATVYRPSVIVGDSGTGYTSTYHGLYRFLEAADRLAVPAASGKRRLPLRLPFGGDEPRNLVPVDWVSQAVTRIMGCPPLHGRTYHLTASEPVRVREIQAAAEEVLGLEGVTLAGPGSLADPTPLETLFLDQLRVYWPYLAGDPTFDNRNTRVALPDTPAPRIDRAALVRLIRFAAADGFGRSRPPERPAGRAAGCGDYVERFFPKAVRGSSLAGLPIDVTFGLDVRGPGGGRWTCRWSAGEVVAVERGLNELPEVVYRLDGPTFAAVVAGREKPQDAFFARRIEIAGNVEKGLRLAVLFGQFVTEFPYRAEAAQEVRHAALAR